MATSSKILNEFNDYFKEMIVDALETKFTHIGAGTGVTAALQTDTDLETEVDINAGADVRQTASIYKDASTPKITFECWISQTEGNGNTLSEVGVADSDDGGTDVFLCRSTFTGQAKTASKEFKIIVEVTPAISLN